MKRVQLVIGGHEVTVAFDEHSLHVFNAFPVKDELKLRGYRWNSLQKSWDYRAGDVEAELERLRGQAPAPPPPAPVTVPPPGEAFPESLGVAQLRERIQAVLRAALPARLWVRGVVASDPKVYRWATYFDLRDEDEGQDMVFAAEVHRDDRRRIEERLNTTGVAASLEKDLPVFLAVEINLSRKYTVNVRLRVVDILPEYTRERLRSQRDVTVERLRKEGLLDLQKGLRLPLLLYRVALVTSALGTSVRDILAGLSPLEKRYQIDFLDTRMEGGNAVDGLIAALDFLESRVSRRPEAVVIARGGGSEQSLGVFNDYRLCARICRCKIPVLTAIGHEKDLSAAEICSHFTPSPSTPSGMGRFLRERFLDLQYRLGESVRRLVERFTTVHRLEGERVRALARQLPRLAAHHLQLARLVMETRTRETLGRGQRFNRDENSRLRQVEHRLLQRSRAFLLRERVFLARTALRLDFSRRRRAGAEAGDRLRRLVAAMEDAARRRLDQAERWVGDRENLVRASHPHRILEKGFAMTLGPGDRVVPTAAAFRTMKRARLRFADGIEHIERKEEE